MTYDKMKTDLERTVKQYEQLGIGHCLAASNAREFLAFINQQKSEVDRRTKEVDSLITALGAKLAENKLLHRDIKKLHAELDDLKRDIIPKLQSALERANKYGLRLEEENKMFKAEFTRFAEAAAPPYILINADAELTAEMIEAIKKQKPVFVPGNEATVNLLDEKSIRTKTVKEVIARVKEYINPDIGFEFRQWLDALEKVLVGENK